MSLQTVTLEVTGPQTIHCASCENAARRALKQLPGVRQVAASHRTQRIDLTLDTHLTSLEEVRDRLHWIGYATQETAG